MTLRLPKDMHVRCSGNSKLFVGMDASVNAWFFSTWQPCDELVTCWGSLAWHSQTNSQLITKNELGVFVFAFRFQGEVLTDIDNTASAKALGCMVAKTTNTVLVFTYNLTGNIVQWIDNYYHKKFYQSGEGNVPNWQHCSIEQQWFQLLLFNNWT